MIADLLLSQWKLVLIAALTAAFTVQTHRLSNAENRLVEVNIQNRLATDAAKAKEKQSRELSTRTAKEINDAQPKLVAQAKANAAELYRRRYLDLHRGDLGRGLRPGGTLGLRDPASAADPGTLQADGAEIPQGQPAGMDAGTTCQPDPRFLAEAAEAAAKLDGWERWRVGNGLEYEQ